MTKKELFVAIEQLNSGFDLPNEYVAKLIDLVKPGVGGGKDVSDYTVFNEDEEPMFIFCNIHKKWEPITDIDGNLLFREDAKSKNGYQRDCIEGITSFKEISKQIKSSEKSIIADVLDGAISPEEGKEAIANLGDPRSSIPDREDGLGCVERPEPDTDPADCKA